MKTLIILLLIMTGYTVGISQQMPAPAAEDLEKLDFWVGKWDLTWEGGSGTNVVEKTLDGRVIQENFQATGGGMKGFKGTSISTFHGADGRWHQAWADSQGGYFNFIGVMEGDQRIFQTEYPKVMPNGDSVMLRMRFYNITPDSFDWDWERSADQGQTWSLSWRIHYERISS
jgi:hypothetical protein